MSKIYLPIVLIAVLLQPACIWKLWSKGGDSNKPPEVKVYDVYGTVTTVERARLVIDSKRGPLEFALVDSSIKGSEFQAGAYVHVYYKEVEGQKEITMVVEKIK